jgi:conjugal transfer pilus assembly protein TraL
MSIPQYRLVNLLDEPERILFFTVEEFLMLIVPIAMGLKFHHSGYGLFLGICGLYSIHKFKKRDGEAFFQYWVYWNLPLWFGRFKKIPPAYFRTLVG